MRKQILRSLALASLTVVALMAAACTGKAGSSINVQGHTYHGNGDVVSIEFKSGGKAFVSTGPVSTPCNYSQSGSNVTLICENDRTNFTVDADDGALIGPPDGMLGRLTRKQ
jgi:hypothetical protein